MSTEDAVVVSVIVTSSMDTAATEGVPSTTVYNRINRDDPETLLEFEVTICILNTNAKIAVCRVMLTFNQSLVGVEPLTLTRCRM